IVWPDLVVVQLAAGVVVGGLGIWLIRPRVSSAFHQGGDGRLGRGVHGTLIGEEVTTLDVVGPDRKGHGRRPGETGRARGGSGGGMRAGNDVVVTGVEGTTLIVWPVSGHIMPPLPPDDKTAPDNAEGETS